MCMNYYNPILDKKNRSHDVFKFGTNTSVIPATFLHRNIFLIVPEAIYNKV